MRFGPSTKPWPSGSGRGARSPTRAWRPGGGGAGPCAAGGIDERAFLGWIRPILRSLEHGPDGLAYLWRPAPFVWLNARVQAGSPCIDHTRVPTLLVSHLVETGDDPEDLADDYGLTKEQIDAAVRFERLLAS